MDQYSFNFARAVWQTWGSIGIYILVGLVALFLFVRFFGAKWIDSRFQRGMEGFKSEQQRQLEIFKVVTNARIDRTTKIHVLEFEILPELWRKFVDAFYHARGVIYNFRMSSDITRFDDTGARKFLERSEFAPEVIEDIMQSRDKQKTYLRHLDIKDYNKGDEAVRDFRLYYRKHAIFVRPELRPQFEALEQLIVETMSEHFVRLQVPSVTSERVKQIEFMKKGEGLLRALETKVQARLWNAHDLGAG